MSFAAHRCLFVVEQKELTQVTCEDAAGQTTEFILGRVLPRQRLDLRCGMNPLALC